MKQTATITFHWSENYGALLQAYALQQTLLRMGMSTELIDYVPQRVYHLQTLEMLCRGDFRFFRKRRLLKQFRKKELHLSSRRYTTHRALVRHCPDYGAVICGSDQIWNESFTAGAEGKPTFSYFLDFLPKGTKKLAYAASFGTEALTQSIAAQIAPLLRDFSRIGVRENSGRQMLEKLGIPAQVVLDPTLLLAPEAYDALLAGKRFAKAPPVFVYILHSGQCLAQEAAREVLGAFGQKKEPQALCCGLYEWLYRLKNAEFVVTNSFHGVAMSIVFQRPFCAVLVEHSGMNDRLITLLTSLGLEDRIVSSPGEAASLIQTSIPWSDVQARLEPLRALSGKFLIEALKE